MADITDIRLTREFVYLAVMLDAYSRKVVGWAAGPHAGRPVAARGVQYASGEYVTMLRTHHMIPSMSRPANPYDHASGESFMKTLKREEIYANPYRNLDHLRTHREAVIARYYNRDRLHSALGYRPPEEFERTMASANTLKGATLRFLRHAEIARTEARGE